jgi:uncharacterized membrane protein
VPLSATQSVVQTRLAAIFHLRQRSLARGNLIVLGSLGLATLISGAPHLQSSPLLVIPALGAILGTADTARCIQKRWSFYHAGVLICLYMDLMAITLVLFFLLYPYFLWFTQRN